MSELKSKEVPMLFKKQMVSAASEQRMAELNQSVEQAKKALSTFSYEPKKAVSTHAELVLHEQIKNLKSSRDFWRFMFFATVFCYGVAWWLV